MMSVIWLFGGYSIVFGNDINGFMGDPLQYFGLYGLDSAGDYENLPLSVYITFQLMFAVITAAILSGPFAERAKFNSYMVFIALWGLMVYSPVARWDWGGGFLQKMGALDFAGGTVVHVNVGAVVLATAFVIGRRNDYKKYDINPHNIPLVLIGPGLLWFGWFGFNGRSVLAADVWAGLAILDTNIAACAGAFAWIMLEYSDSAKGKPGLIGMATGVLAGLVGVTPAAGYVEP